MRWNHERQYLLAHTGTVPPVRNGRIALVVAGRLRLHQPDAVSAMNEASRAIAKASVSSLLVVLR